MAAIRSQATSSGNDEDAAPNVSSSDEPRLQVPIPFSSAGLATYGYQQVLANRIDERLLAQGAKFDIQDYPPTFIHDIMMLPGSLAELLGKECPMNVIRKMTPALLPGVQAQVAADTLLPCLVHSAVPQAYVQGILVFGLGKEARKIIHRHYRPHAKRTRVRVEVDLKVPSKDPESHVLTWDLQRRVFEARAWLCKSDQAEHKAHAIIKGATWTLEKFLEGKLEPRQTLLRIVPGLRGDEDEDGYIGREVEEKVIEEETREIVHGSSGGLDYERSGTLRW